jgi:hypothetical protein
VRIASIGRDALNLGPPGTDDQIAMSRSRRLPRSLLACLVVLAGVVALGAAPQPAHAVGADDTIVGPSRVSPAQMAAWFRARTVSPYAVNMPIDQLAALYVSEGNLAGVRGDIAFAQSIVETRWFSFPAGGLLTAGQNNFAGIGACDSCSTGVTFPTIQLGVRAQMQQLRRYADPSSRASSLGAPLVTQLWSSATSYDRMDRTHGWAPTWQSLSGTWATATSYAATISQLYNSMWVFAGRPGALHWNVWEIPGDPGISTAAMVGGLGSGAAVASWQFGRLDVFGTSASGALLHKWWDGRTWSAGWENLSNPPSGPIVGSPAATSWGPNRVDVFVRGSDSQLWRTAWDGQRWTGWTTLGGVLTSSPAVASQGVNQLDVVVNGTDRQLWHTAWSGSGWSPWTGLGGVVVGNPAAVSPAPGRVDLFVRGTDDGLYQKTGNAGSWSLWLPLGGRLTSGPAASSWDANRIDLFVRGTDGGLWTRNWDGTGWHFYEALGGALTSDPAAVSWSPSRIDVFVRGSDGQLWHRFGT